MLRHELAAIDQLVERWREWEMEALRTGSIFDAPGKMQSQRITLDTLVAVSQRLQDVTRAHPDLLVLQHSIEITYVPTSSTPAPRRSLRTSVATFLDFTFRTRARKAFWLPLAWSVLMAVALLVYRAVRK
jgi:hypothetical protein